MYKFVLFSFISCIIISETSANLGKTEKCDEFKFYPDVGWVHYHPIPVRWSEARTRCYYEGAELMSPIDEKMLKVMSDIAGTNAMWTGVHATYSKVDYFSISGVPLYKMPISWAQDEPNNDNNNEECLLMVAGGKIADCSCTETYAFSCYKPNNINTCPCSTVSGYQLVPRTNSCYKFHTNAQNWTKAFMICAAEGGHLAVMDSLGEQQVLQDIYSKYPDNVIRGGANYKHFIQLGYRDWEDHMLWMTINGKNIEDLVNSKLTVWAQHEPNNAGQNEYCGGMTRAGTLNDVPCHFKMPYICEIENKPIY